MTLIYKRLADVRGVYGLDEKEVTLEWLVFSNDDRDFAVSIAKQGIVPDMVGSSGQALGWLAPGRPYQLGNDFWNTCYAGAVEVGDREIVGGSGDYKIVGTNVIIQRNGNPLIKWRVKQRFSTKERKEDEGDGEPSVNDQVTIRTSVEWEDIPFEHDMIEFDDLVLNSAGEKFNPPAVRRRKILVYSITRRERRNPVAKSITYSNTVNDGAMYGAIAGALLMDSIICDYDGQAWTVTYNIKEKTEGWNTALLDTGFNERMPDGRLIPILDDVATPISEPAKLDGMGRRQPDQTLPGVNVGPFHKYPIKNFHALQIPNFFLINTVQSQ